MTNRPAAVHPQLRHSGSCARHHAPRSCPL